MTRALVLVLVLLAAVGALVLAFGSGSGAVESLAREEPAAQRNAERSSSALTGGDEQVAQVPQDTRREVAPVDLPAETHASVEHDSHAPHFGEDYLDITVRHMDGTPAKSIAVSVKLSGSSQAGSLVLSSEDGRYRIDGLSPGQWIVFVHQAPEFFASPEDYGRSHVVPHPGPPPEFVLYPGGKVSGVVLDSEGAPMGDEVLVHVLEMANEEEFGQPADAETGSFELGPLPAGEYRLQARSKSGASEIVQVQVQPGRTTEGVVLRLPPGGWLDVTVLDPQGDPIPDVDVVLLAEEDIFEGGQTDDQGRTRFGPLSVGTWSVAAVMDEGDRGSFLSADAEVTAGDTISVVLQPPTDGITVTGRVTRAGIPEADMEIYFFREGVGLVAGANMTKTAENGTYEALLSDPGPYQVMFQGNRPMPFRRVEIPDAETFALDLALPGGTVSGRVTDMGKHGGGVEVLLEREDGYLEHMMPDEDPSERADGDGAFAFEDVRPGVYRLRVLTEGGGYAAMLTGIVVGVDEQVSGLELAMRVGASVNIALSRADGTEIRGASVVARTLSGAPLSVDEGPGTLVGLPPGRVLISAQTGSAVAVREVVLKAGEQTKVELVLEEGAFLDVVCEQSGNPMGAGLRLYGPDGDEVTCMLPAETSRPTYTSVVSSSTRRFGPLPPGTYEATATAPDGKASRRSVKLDAGETQMLVIEL